jgi:D-alanyl-D-alanine dipeptidase
MTNRITLLAWHLLYQSLPYPLDSLKKTIPLRPEGAATALGYHGQPVDIELPLSKEPLVQAKTFGFSSESYYARTDGTNAPYNRSIPGALPQVWMRESVAIRLAQVNQLLSSRALEIHLLDAYRPIETQQSLWDHFIEIGKVQLDTNDYVQLREFAGHYVSEPDGFDASDSLTWPTHNTGGAVDVTLRSKQTGQLLNMGSGYDESTPLTFTDAFERDDVSNNNSARDNRRILYNAMHKFGFANYPYEWWHFDHGTQMWLQNGGNRSGCTTAWYGPALLP